MTYNELAQVLEVVAEDGTFPVNTLDMLNVLDFNENGTAMLEDGLYARSEWLAKKVTRKSPSSSCAHSSAGRTCRDNPSDCVDYVLAAGPTLGVGHGVDDKRSQQAGLAVGSGRGHSGCRRL